VESTRSGRLGGREDPLQDDVFQVSAAVEDSRDHNFGADDSVQQTVGWDLNLAVITELKTSQLGYDPATLRHRAKSGGFVLDPVKESLSLVGISVKNVIEDPEEITPGDLRPPDPKPPPLHFRRIRRRASVKTSS
jgi:hypothetical protein